MFGGAYFGKSYFGRTYWGPGSGTPVPPVPPDPGRGATGGGPRVSEYRRPRKRFDLARDDQDIIDIITMVMNIAE